MNALPYVLVVIGFAGFLSGIVYELVHHERDGGPVYQGRKHIVFPWVIASWLVFGVGFAMLAIERA
ncbi:hypothetical protein [Frigoribacterium faeni]|uniref:hypothetical protein n=1 Tax=Frigoribacterium faeni TaxID=145483 RepID=UPI00141B6FAB|nr:hypothetical protein [Frigoribacterium faeni]NIJ05690.1 hypothetical protein [Frigoribacterium faeni]